MITADKKNFGFAPTVYDSAWGPGIVDQYDNTNYTNPRPAHPQLMGVLFLQRILRTIQVNLRHRLTVAIGISAGIFLVLIVIRGGATKDDPVKTIQSGPGVPALAYFRTLTAPNVVVYPLTGIQTGTSGVTWSADGKSIAAIALAGTAIEIWNADDGSAKQLARRGPLSYQNVLGFVAGHSQIITPPADAAAGDDPAAIAKLKGVSLSVLDAATGTVIQNIAAPHPNGNWSPENAPYHLAVSPDQSLIAVSYNDMFHRPDGATVYATNDWRRIGYIKTDESSNNGNISSIAFTHDGKYIIAGRRDGSVIIYDIVSDKTVKIFQCFQDVIGLWNITQVSVSYDDTMFAVSSIRGGRAWLSENGRITDPKHGTLHIFSPPDPVRVFSMATGKQLMSAGEFFGGAKALAWSPNRNFFAFIPFHGDLHLLNPAIPHTNDTIVRVHGAANSLAFSPDGSMIAVTTPTGVVELKLLPSQ